MELWIGVISEPVIWGAICGEVSARIVGSTFERIRSGDRFWYENAYPADIVSELRRTSLTAIMERNFPN